MTDRPLGRDGLLAGLQDIRLPVDAPGGALAEILAAVGLGLFLAALCALALSLVTRQGPKPAADASLVPDPGGRDRVSALLRELKARRPDRFAALAPRLYAPGGLPTVEELERELAGA